MRRRPANSLSKIKAFLVRSLSVEERKEAEEEEEEEDFIAPIKISSGREDRQEGVGERAQLWRRWALVMNG